MRAEQLYADPSLELDRLAGIAWRGGFTGGSEWMRVALGGLRQGNVPRGSARFTRLGLIKYAACAGSAVVLALATWALESAWWWAGVMAIGGFYLVEVQFVFLFPVALDHGESAWGRSRRLMWHAGGTVRALTVVLPIVVRMLSGGRRGWCCGCLEVLLWYEETRGAPTLPVVLPRLQLGNRGPLVQRVENLFVPGLSRLVRVAWVSDVHLWRRGTVCTARAVILAIRRMKPDVIVLGGDLVDGVRGLRQLELMVRGLVRVAPVWALAGNHDEAFGVERVVVAVRAGGGAWLPDGVVCVGDGAVSLVAGEFDQGQAYPRGVLVACRHNPAGADGWDGRARVVLAGHLHGGQIALAKSGGRNWPAALVYRWCGPRFELRCGTTLLVGSGVGDLLPLRWRCPREILCVNLVPDKPVETEGAS